MDALAGVGLHGDGVPCNWDRSESVETVSINLPGLPDAFKKLRLPVVSLPHSSMCAETWDDIMEVIAHSFKYAAAGVFMTERHDESPWRPSDAQRKTNAGKSMGYQAVLVEIRGDWKFYAETFHMPKWNQTLGICWRCRCTRDQVIVAWHVP